VKRLLVLCALASVAAPAAAQSSAALDPAALVAARQSLAEFATCLSTSKQDRIARLFDLPVDSPEYRRIAQRLYETEDSACVSDGSLKYNRVLFSGALFGALYTRDFGYGGPSSFPETLTTRYAERYRAPHSADARQAIALEAFGECVARAEPATARQLLLSTPGTAAEQTQFAALAPRFGACVVKDARVEMSKSIVRGAVAEGLYRLSRAAGKFQ
jgi:hypothetical protein